MFGFWDVAVLIVVLSALGGGLRIWSKHRLAMRQLELEQLKIDHARLQEAVNEQQRLLEGRIEALETIATGADEALHRRLQALNPRD